MVVVMGVGAAAAAAVAAAVVVVVVLVGTERGQHCWKAHALSTVVQD